jgi:hypothetical protein
MTVARRPNARGTASAIPIPPPISTRRSSCQMVRDVASGQPAARSERTRDVRLGARAKITRHFAGPMTNRGVGIDRPTRPFAPRVSAGSGVWTF